MWRTMCMASALMKAAVVANQCPRSDDEPQNVMSLLQSQLQVNVPEVGGEEKYDFDVDVVYTWVAEPKEGSSAWKEIQTSCGSVDPQRYRNHGTFLASVKAVAAFLPWVRKVFIVSSGEEPCWKDEMNIQIEMVRHDQIFLQKTDLPSHNSVAIETNLHRIPGLAEQFIYFNDDTFPGKPLSKSFFFTPHGKPIYDTEPKTVGPGSYGTIASTSCQIKFIATHQANAFRKSAIEKQHLVIGDPFHFKEFSGKRCRQDKPAIKAPPFWTYMCYHIDNDYAVAEAVHQRNAFLGIETDATRDAWYSSVLEGRPDRFCINDDFDRTNSKVLEQQDAALANFLHQFMTGNSLTLTTTSCQDSFVQIENGMMKQQWSASTEHDNSSWCADC